MDAATLNPPLPQSPTTTVGAEARPLLERFQYHVLAGLLLVFCIVGWQGREPTSIGGGDELIYLTLSQSLESGSYREIYRPTAPLHVQYPPVYPAWLIPLRHIAGSHFDLIRATNMVLVGIALLLLFQAIRRLGGPLLAIAVVSLLVVNPGILLAGGSLMSEGPFLLLSTVALVLMLRPERVDRRLELAIIAISLVAFLTRIIGLALLLAVGIWLWSERRRAALWIWGIASALVGGAWFTYSHFARADSSVRSYLPDIGAGARGSVGLLRHLVKLGIDHAAQYATTDIPFALALPTVPGTVVDNWIWLGVTAVLLTAGFFLLWRAWKAAAAYLFIYMVIILFWTWQDGRLLNPIIPLALLAMFLGLRWIAGMLPRRVGMAAMVAVWGLAAFGAAHRAEQRISRFAACDHAAPPSRSGCYDPGNTSMAAAAEYLKAHAAPGDVALGNKPFSIYFLTGHPTEEVTILRSTPEGQAADTLRARHVRFVIVQPSYPWLLKQIVKSCHGFLVEKDLLPDALLLSTRPPNDSSPDACAALGKMKPVLPPGWNWNKL